MNPQLDDIVRRLAPPAGPGLTPGARETMFKIMDEEPAPSLPARGRRRALLALPAALGALAASLAVVVTLGPASASALDVKDEGGYFVIEVKDMFAKPEAYQQQLRDAGLDIKLRLLPSTPSNVGSVAPSTVEPDGIKVIDRQEGCETAGGCPISIKVRRDFKGSAELVLGREARPGEEYQIITGFDVPGEPMHCAPYYNRPVSEVRTLLRDRGVDIQAFDVLGPAFWTKEGKETEPVTKASVPESMHVVGGYLTMAGKAAVQVSDSDLPADLVRTLKEKAGCPPET
ncbi:hypothetical protein ACIBQ6_20205 [Nonomuraea sp. NPDC049655]|uniref:hypothetical protein n=1 Tax=Nonomuraea sp. NPDC049655 TaxID=3364355 RepID=UPI0037A7E664